MARALATGVHQILIALVIELLDRQSVASSRSPDVRDYEIDPAVIEALEDFRLRNFANRHIVDPLSGSSRSRKRAWSLESALEPSSPAA